MEKKRKSRDLKEVLRQEQGRGKRYVPSEEEKEAYRRSQKQLRDILWAMKWEEVVTALSLRKGKPEYDEYYQVWRDYHRDCDESC
jgi:hypothetical protein